MCGIAGILRVQPAGAPVPPPETAIPEQWLDILDESIKHRGPDGHGRFRDRATWPDGTVVDVAFVHRRLAIIDIADGTQPMVSADRQIAVVFNGCIHNHRELRKELQAAGHRFVTDHSDTEVLIHGWREWNTRALDHLIGMYACAIWDRRSAEVLVLRSSPGERPLYRAGSPERGVHAFASTASALAHLGRVVPWDSSLDSPGALGRWIAFGQDSRDCPVPGVEQAAFGYAASLGPEAPDSIADFEEGGQLRGGDRGRASKACASRGPALIDALDSLVADAVGARIEADVPVGCLLSGGVDSSLIAAHAIRHAGRLTTVCIRMPFPEYDESPFAEAVARQIGSSHHVIDTSPHPASDLVHLIHGLGLPFGDSSLLPTYWACIAARKEVGVALTGDGGDELFFGYERYRAADYALLLRNVANFVPVSLLNRTNPNGRGDRLARLVTAARHHSSSSLLAIFQKPDFDALVGPERARELGWGVNFGASRMRRGELYRNLQGDMLRKVDTAALAAHLETRAPFLDQTLLLAVHDLSARELMPGGQRKGLLRQIARKYLPSEIVDRPKQGFAIPIGEWFRSDYGGMKQLLLDHLNSAEPWGPPSLGINLNMKFVRQMLDEHMGTRMSGRVVRDHSQRLYMLLVLSIWAKWVGSLAP
jgi:asparagine synthase (glutamine-hydrolysing)